MIEWVTWVGIGIAALAGVVALVAGIAGRPPSDYTVGGLVLVEVFLIAQGIVAVTQLVGGATSTGDLVEWWLYWGVAMIIPPLAVVWALIDRTRYGTVALGVTALAISVMVLRMSVIWGG